MMGMRPAKQGRTLGAAYKVAARRHCATPLTASAAVAQTTSVEVPVPIPVGIPVFALSHVAFGNRFLALRRPAGEAGRRQSPSHADRETGQVGSPGPIPRAAEIQDAIATFLVPLFSASNAPTTAGV